MSVIHSERHENAFLSALILGFGIGLYFFSNGLSGYVVPQLPALNNSNSVKLVMAPDTVVVKPEPKPVVKPEPKPVVKPEPKPVVKPEPKPVVKSEPKPVVKPEPKPVVEPKPKPVVKPESKPKSDAQTLDDLFGTQVSKSPNKPPVYKSKVRAQSNELTKATELERPRIENDVFAVSKNSSLDDALTESAQAAKRTKNIKHEVKKSNTLDREITHQSGAVEQAILSLFAKLKTDIRQEIVLSGTNLNVIRVKMHFSNGIIDSVEVKDGSSELVTGLRKLLIGRQLSVLHTGTKVHSLVVS